MRKKLPETRDSVTSRVKHGGLDIYITVGFYNQEVHTTILSSSAKPLAGTSYNNDVEQPGEVFIKIGKEGSSLGGLLDGTAVLMSLLLQYNVPWERIARKMYDTNFEPCDNGKSILHTVVLAVDKLLKERGSITDKGHSL